MPPYSDSPVDMSMNETPLRIGDKLYIYYDGMSTRHSVKLRDVKTMGIGLATLRPQGFVSVDAGPAGGMLVPRPLSFSGTDLRLNQLSTYSVYTEHDFDLGENWSWRAGARLTRIQDYLHATPTEDRHVCCASTPPASRAVS